MCHIFSKSLYILNRIDSKYRLIFIFHVRRASRVFIGQGRFSEARAQFLFFQISSNKLRSRVAIPDSRGVKVYSIFNGTTIAGAVGKILKIMLAIMFQIAILEL